MRRFQAPFLPRTALAASLRAALVLAVAGLLGACGPQARPLTREALGQHVDHAPGAMLVRYLGQPAADAEVCDAGAPERPRQPLSRADARALVRGLDRGAVPAATWSACAIRLDAWAGEEVALILLDGAVDALLDAQIRATRADPDALAAAIPPYVAARAPAAGASARVVRRHGARLDAHRRVPAVARVATLLEIEGGRLAGEPVDAARIGRIGDVGLLADLYARLPDPTLRAHARSRAIDVAIATNPRADVRAEADAVRARLHATGRNAVDADDLMRARLDANASALRIVARQDVPEGVVRFAAERDGSAALLPVLPLRAHLSFEHARHDGPLRLCDPDGPLDATPCVDAADLAPDGPLVRLDARGDLRFAERLPFDEARDLLVHRRHEIPLRVGGRTLATPSFTVRVAEPPPLIRSDGEDLIVRLEPARDAWLASVESPALDAPLRVVFTTAHALDGGFRIVARGRAGAAGADGSAGAQGMHGTTGLSASCPGSSGQSGGSGGRGYDGSPGQAGGHGGRGGDVDVWVRCGPVACHEVRALAELVVVSEGGPGGPGGRGGAGGLGGSGGAGGMGTTCTTTDGRTTSLSSGSMGTTGAPGSRGADGARGAAGAPGEVRIRVER